MSILEPDDQLTTLRLVHEQLRPDGLLAIDVFDPRLDLIGPDGAPVRSDVGTFVNPDTGRPVRVTVLDRVNDPVRQRFTEHWEFAELDELGHAIRADVEALTLRWTFRHEMRHLLSAPASSPSPNTATTPGRRGLARADLARLLGEPEPNLSPDYRRLSRMSRAEA